MHKVCAGLIFMQRACTKIRPMVQAARDAWKLKPVYREKENRGL